jgi:hypothetical protein
MTTLSLVKAHNSVGVRGGVKGASFAFISTLDAAAHALTLELGTKIEVLFRASFHG